MLLILILKDLLLRGGGDSTATAPWTEPLYCALRQGNFLHFFHSGSLHPEYNWVVEQDKNVE